MQRDYDSQIDHWNVWLQSNRVTMLGSDDGKKNTYSVRINSRAFVKQVGDCFTGVQDDMIGAHKFQMEYIRICGRRCQFTKTRRKGSLLTILLPHRHQGFPQGDILRDVKHISNHRIPFRARQIPQPSGSPSSVGENQRGGDCE